MESARPAEDQALSFHLMNPPMEFASAPLCAFLRAESAGSFRFFQNRKHLPVRLVGARALLCASRLASARDAQLLCPPVIAPRKDCRSRFHVTPMNYSAGRATGADEERFVGRAMRGVRASGGLRDQSLKNPLLLPPGRTTEGAHPKRSPPDVISSDLWLIASGGRFVCRRSRIP